jgi:hypothetical protein
MESIRTAITQASNYLTEHPEVARSTDAAATATLEMDSVFESADRGCLWPPTCPSPSVAARRARHPRG